MTSERGEHVPPVLPELSIHLKSGVLEVLVQLKSCKLKFVIDPPGVLLEDQVDKATTLGGVQWDG